MIAHDAAVDPDFERPALVSGTLAHLWVYLAAPILGAAIAVPLWRAVYNHPGNDE